PQGPLTLPPEGLRDVTVVLGPDSSIEGILVDGNGAPMEEVRISLWPEPSYWSTLPGFDTKPTDSEGHFRVAGLWPAAYRVSIGLPGEDSRRPLENVAPIEVGVDEAITGVVLVYEAEEAHTISGHVTDHRGRPVKGATVVASGASWDQASTDEFGFYCLSEIKEGSNDLLVWHRRFCTARTSDIPEGSDDVDFELIPRGAVEGCVLDADTRQPITDFEILEHSRKDWWQGRAEYVRVQDNEGRFVLTGIETREECTVVARAEGYVPAGSDPFVVRGGATTRGVIVKLERGSSLSGVVLNPEGNPVRNARITLGEFPRSRMLVDEFARAVTERDGSFRVDSLPVGEMTVHAHHPNFGPARVTVHVEPDAENRVELTLGRGGTLRGVICTQGVPIPALQVSIGDVSPALYEARTDENGVYISWLLGEDFVLFALSHDGKETWRHQIPCGYVSKYGPGASPIVLDGIVIM
ncbi:MAG: carboxypeptidase regulatory-like domain-containing protein, partial [bacterium]|nr:carboxypeptidase regulatory-like domain-containing protein [bacterium]